jgi:hypothetical protein
MLLFKFDFVAMFTEDLHTLLKEKTYMWYKIISQSRANTFINVRR